MPSEYTVTVNVEPFVRRFLYAHFNEKADRPFAFPSRHKFNRLIEDLLFKPPLDYRKQDYCDNTMEFVIPHLEFKNEAVYNYMPESMQRVFNRRISIYITDIFELKFRNLIRNQGMTKEEAISNLQFEFGFLPEDNDRLIKHYYRWIRSEYNRKYRRKKKIEERKNFA